jgi:hypothetical protein
MFNECVNPATIFLSMMVLFGLAGIIGKILTYYDNKRGYCNIDLSKSDNHEGTEKNA